MKNCRNLNCDYHRSRPLKSAKQHLDKLELFWKEGLWAEEVKFECFGHNDKQEGGGVGGGGNIKLWLCLAVSGRETVLNGEDNIFQ